MKVLDPYLDGPHTVVAVIGDVDVATAPSLRDALLALLNRGASSLVVDLRAVTFLDSTGVGSLLRVFHRQSLLGGVVHFVADQPAVLRVFDIMQLRRRLHVTPTLEDIDLCCPAAVDLEAGRPAAASA